MFLATIATANHYFLDGLVGSVVALTGLAIAWRISRPQSRPVTAHVAPIRPIKSRVLGQGWAQDRAA
jgi:membrane-associated phospholipid phosphatase